MKNRKKLLGIVLALAVIGAGTGLGFAAAGDDEEPLTGTVLEQATAAALAHTGEGTVVETETGDGGAAYGVEIQLDDGSQVEVSLDENFKVVDTEADEDTPGEEDD